MLHKRHASLHLSHPSFKFYAAHMTAFPDGSKESLHGHNYQVSLDADLRDTSFNKMVSYSVFKDVIRSVCELLDEKILLAEKCPLFCYKKLSNSYQVTYQDLEYLFPLGECVMMPIENVSAECLAGYFLEFCVSHKEIQKHQDNISCLKLGVSEAKGLAASQTIEFEETT